MDNENKTIETTETEAASAPKKRRVNRRLRYGATATALTAVVVAAVILLNVLVTALENRFPLTIDLTADEIFTLSDDTLKIIEGIEDEVEVIVFQDESYYSTPAFTDEVNTVVRQFYEAMRQCHSVTNGRITTRYINYADNPTLVKPYAQYEVDENSILFLSGNRSGVIAMTDLFAYDQQTYYYYGEIDVTESLVDRTVASNLLKVTGNLAPVVMLTGHAENSATVSNIKAVLANNAYEVEECDLTRSQTINEDAITLVIPAPSTDYSAEEIAVINAWLQQKGEYSRNLVLFTDYAADCPNLYELVQEEYGITVTDHMIRETVSYYSDNYTPYGDIPESEFSAEVTSQKVLVPNIQQLLLGRDNNSELSLYNVPIVTFGDTAQLVDIPDELNAEEEPVPYNAETYPVVGAAVAHKQVPSPTINMTVHSYAAVFASPHFLNESVLTYFNTAENEALFMNVFNTLSGSENTVTISSRSMTAEVLEFEAGMAKVLGLGVFAIGLPLVTLLLGIVLFLRRRHL